MPGDVLLGEILSVGMFAVVCAVLMLGFPVAFALAGTALAFALIGAGLGVFDLRLLGGLPSRYLGIMVNEVLVAVPLFVFMGVMLERARIADQLLETMGLLFGRMRGGLGIAVVFVGMLLAASTGIVGATVVTMGLLSLPTMLRAGYDPKLATGTICASGTLGQIIPPSIVLVLLGDILQGAYAEAQRAVGNWAPEPVSVIDLFAGAFIPGMILVVLYMAWILIQAVVNPASCPALLAEGEKIDDLGHRVATALVPPGILILAVIGSILAGIATPTEAAAVGCVGALLLAARAPGEGATPARTAGGWLRRLARHPVELAGLAVIAQIAIASAFDLRMQLEVVSLIDALAFALALVAAAVLVWGLATALIRLWRWKILTEVMHSTVKITSMVFVILLGASVFSLVFRGLGGDRLVADVLHQFPGGAFGAIAAVMVVMFVLGFFLDFIEIIFVVVPIVGPVILQMDVHPVWLGVMIAINLQTSFLTPPFGFALFFLRGVAPPEVKTTEIYRGIIPFVVIQLVVLALVGAWPALATWLPKALFP
ncbi:MAG: TRAP transporter large permease subunit [Rhodospirillales bacterium]|jgi:TRAP-type mannitol/chloroaromatic compound transport system permease large subunit|nr:TRAP transporter large permease subunit [Rhodospirillales bacterium]